MFRWKISIIIQIIVLSLLILPKDSFAIDDVGKWKRFEVSYTDTSWSGNAFDVVVDGVFTHTQSETQIRVPGFYAGNNVWKIFFMPTKLGEWTFTTTSPDSDLNGHSGSLNCVESGLPGQLVPVGNRWKLVDEGFTAPIIVHAGHGWFREVSGYTDFDEFLVFARDIMGSPIIFHNFGRYDYPLDGTGNVWVVEGEEFNIPMFDRMNQRFDALRDAGMGNYFFLYSDDEDTPAWGGQSVKELRYFRYMVARFSAYPVVSWDTGTDIGEFRSDSWIDWFADYIPQIDPYDHPVGSRSRGGSGGKNPASATYFSDGGYTSGHIGHNSWLSTWNSRSIPTAFTYIWCSNAGNGPYYINEIRRAIWELGLVGGPGVSLGINWNLESFDTLPFSQSFELAPYVGYANTFFKNSIADLGALDPHDELVTSGNNVVLSADIGNEYVAYLNNGGSIHIDLSDASGTLNVEWYNPRTGIYSGQTTITGGSSNEPFTAQDSNDWVLHIGNGGSGTSPDSTPPTSPQDLNASAQSENQINLTWQAADDPESGIGNYNVFRNGIKIAQPTMTSFTDTGLNEGTTYSYEVSSVNGAGLESDKSNPASVTTLPDTDPPTVISASTSSDPNKITIVFSEPIQQSSATNPTNYQISNGITVSGASLGTDLKTVTLTTGTHSEGITYTLTINNIEDRAVIANVIAGNTNVSYTFTEQFTVSNLNVSSGRNYEVVSDGLQDGATVYTDRGYTFTTVPSSLQGAIYIKTANDDKASTGSSFLTFDVTQDVTVYVAHDDNTSTKPPWLSSFADLGDNLIATHTPLSIFAKDFPSGTVVIGGNEGAAGSSMYSVIIRSTSSIDTVSPKPPSNLRKKE